MSLEIYWGSGSAPSWRVLLTAVVKGVEFESRLLQFSKGEHKSPDFLAVNPRGKVPAVRDGAFTLNESLAIMAWLDAKHPEPRLFGTTPDETGAIWSFILETENTLSPAVTAIARPVLFGADWDEPAIQMHASTVRSELRRLEDALSLTPWLTGKRMTAADIAAFPTVQFLARVATREKARDLVLGIVPLAAHYPHVAQWCARIETIPGYERTYPPHWREG